MTDRHGSWSFEPQDLRLLDQLLGGFLQETNARCAVLMDRAGRLLTAAGDTAGLDGIAFASLAAADYAASDQLAVLLGEDEFSSLYHQGEARSMYLADVGGQAILAALFDGRTTLGLVRLKAKAVTPALASLFAAATSRGPAPGAALEADWADVAADEIDRLFAD